MVFYGHQVEQVDPFIQLNDEAVINSSRAGIPTTYWVNTFPMRESQYRTAPWPILYDR